MTDEQAHLAGILAMPEDDLPRLVYADWLRERGETDRADFIEVQCELPRIGWQSDGSMRTGCAEDDRREILLRRRERELFAAAEKMGWFAGLGLIRLGLGEPTHDIGRYGIVRRGFVAEVRTTLAGWCGSGVCRTCAGRGHSQHEDINGNYYPCPTCRGTGEGRLGTAVVGIGPAVVANHPVEVVTLSDKEPFESEGTWSWYPHGYADGYDPDNHEASDLPPVVCSLLADWDVDLSRPQHHAYYYDTPELAKAALSAALIQLARSQPPVEAKS